MKKKQFLIVVEKQEDHEFSKEQESYVYSEPVEVGAYFRGGKVIRCAELKKIAEEQS